MSKKPSIKNLIPKFNIHRLTVIKFHHLDKLYRKYFLFRCDCRNIKIIHGSAVISGNTKSCGCLSRENHLKRQEQAQKTKQGAKTAVYLGYKRHAKDRAQVFELTKNELINISQKKCKYCQAPPSNIKKTKNDKIGWIYNGIDRIDNNKGYSLKNCVPCCRICNYAKSNMSLVDFQKWAIQLGKNAMADQWG